MNGSMPESNPAGGVQAVALQDDVARGVAYLHARINAVAGRTFDASSFVYALIELLVEKKYLNVEELDGRKKTVAGRLVGKFAHHDGGVSLQDPGIDKYGLARDRVAVIDCESRVRLCNAACCKMVFPLSRQDIEEGVIRWDLGAPYVIAKDADGYCRHFDRTGRGCSEHARRPVPCRVYDCRNDPRIWIDFASMTVNPKLHAPDWPFNLTAEERSLVRNE